MNPERDEAGLRSLSLKLSELLEELGSRVEGDDIGAEEKKAAIERAVAAAGSDVTVPIEILQFRNSLTRETDRGLALAASAYLAAELHKLLTAHLVQHDDALDSLFGRYGPLASFSASVDLAFAVGLLSEKARRDLHLIRKIRNIFAHDPAVRGFADSDIASRCAELYHDGFREALDPRRKFTRVVLGVLAMIHAAAMSARQPTSPAELDLDSAETRERWSRLRRALNEEFDAILRDRHPRGDGESKAT